MDKTQQYQITLAELTQKSSISGQNCSFICRFPVPTTTGIMIQEIGIENYKSIQELKIELGRITVLIGENGCGKTNILEAIALSSIQRAKS
ncbi:MAG TPA: AAA family ATPase [Phormidium sp.]